MREVVALALAVLCSGADAAPKPYAPAMVLVQVRPSVANPESVICQAIGRLSRRRRPLSVLAVHRMIPLVTPTDSLRQEPISRSGSDVEASIHALGLDRWFVVRLRQPEADIPSLVHALLQDSTRFECAEPDYKVHLD